LHFSSLTFRIETASTVTLFWKELVEDFRKAAYHWKII